MDKALQRVLELQDHYTWENTPEMQERGELVRGPCREWVETQSSVLRDRFPENCRDLDVDARDAVGRKSHVPWVRLYSKSLAPRATVGWYLTYLFAADGSAVYLCVGRATTSEDRDDLFDRIEWARNLLGDVPPGFLERIELAAPDGSTGATFEDGVVEAVRYERDSIPDVAALRDDLDAAASRLATIYAAVLRGEEPSPEQRWADRLHDALESVTNLSAPSANKFAAVDVVIAEAAGLARNHVYTAGVSKPGNLSVRFDQSDRAQNSRLGVAVLYDQSDVDNCTEASRGRVERGRPQTMALVDRDVETGRWRLAQIVSLPDAAPLVRLGAQYPRAVQQIVGSISRPTLFDDTPTVLDGRTDRMLRASVRSSTFTVLVGPPGTGKSRLIERLLTESQADPSSLGLAHHHQAVWTTPDENWTVRQLVGGDSVDEHGRIVFEPGYLLRAIAADRHLVLDELNRADMDRIFGGALTFLAGQEVVVGRTTAGEGGRDVVLRWRDAHSSQRSDEVETIVYEAGEDFRIFGTFNSVDAHQVFRMGQALGRRFRQVPIAPASTEDFEQLLQGRLESVQLNSWDAEWVADTVGRLYEVHLGLFETRVIPASFLDMPAHVAHSEGPLAELTTEAYVACLGGWLARLEPTELQTLGKELIEQNALTDDDWLWVRGQLQLLS